MKALEILKNASSIKGFSELQLIISKDKLNEAIEELENLQNENKSLVKTLEKYNKEMIELRKENQDLKNSNNELLEYLRSTQKRLEEWLEKWNTKFMKRTHTEMDCTI